jgi:hypothetical protein
MSQKERRVRRPTRELGFAFLAWLAPFVVSVCLFPLKKSNLPLFESLMAVTLASSTVLLGCAYFKRLRDHFLARGVRAGMLWMIANWLLDGLMFSSGPMKMTVGQYAADIGTAYGMIPVITLGLAYTAGRQRAEADISFTPAGVTATLPTTR